MNSKGVDAGSGVGGGARAGTAEDRLHMEEQGLLSAARTRMRFLRRARERGFDQLGTLGAGNHFVEVQVVDEVFDEKTAAGFRAVQGQICIMVHSGSRGFGYQVCTDFLPVMDKRRAELRDRTARPATGVRAADEPRRAALSGGDEMRGEFCLGQPADDAPSRARGAGRA